MGIFQRLNKERGITVLLITHETDIAEYGTRLIRFRDGRVVADSARAAPPQRRRRARGAAAAGAGSDRADGRAGSPPHIRELPARTEEHDMSILMTIRIAFKALGRNKLRTALTMLGMIIGVAAVIAMVALGSGAQADDRGAGQVRRHQPHHDLAWQFSSAGGAQGRLGSNTRLVEDDAKALRELPEVLYVAEIANTRSQLIYGNQNWQTNIEGANVDLPLIRSWQVQYGGVLHGGRRAGGEQGHRARRERLGQALRRRRRSDRHGHSRPQSRLQGARRHGAQGRDRRRPEPGRPGLRAVHDRHEEAVRSAEPEPDHRVVGARPTIVGNAAAAITGTLRTRHEHRARRPRRLHRADAGRHRRAPHADDAAR